MQQDEYVEVRVLDWVQPIEVLRARYTTFEFPMHAHTEFMIGAVLQGTEEFVCMGREVIAPEGWLMHLNPAEAHNGRAAQDSWSYVSFYPGISLLREAIPEAFSDGEPRFATPVSHRPELKGRIARFVANAFDGVDELTLQANLFVTLEELFESARVKRVSTRQSKRSAAVACVRARLSDDWASNVSLLELAHSVALTPLQLMRAFREEVGCTPQTFRTARRLDIARALLRKGCALSDVALRCGFSDQSHLTNTMRRWTGLTPGAYQAAVRASSHAQRVTISTLGPKVL